MQEVVKPSDVAALNSMSPEDISAFSEQVMLADRALGEVNEELSNLSACLVSLDKTKEAYDRKARVVKGQMRNLATRL